VPATNITRRHFLAAAAALPSAIQSLAETVVAGPRWLFLGTDKGKGIYRAPWNVTTGELGKIELAIEADRPDFFALTGEHAGNKVLYSVNSVAGGKGAVSSFRVNTQTGSLQLLNRVSSNGDGPCFISIDTWGDSAFVANYSGGSFAAFRLRANGELQPTSSALDCRQNPSCGSPGPVKDRQEAAHLHCATVSPENDFVLACDLGDDAIEVIPINPGEQQVLGKPIRIPARPGSGPRHLAFHPNGRWLYCIHELDCTVDLYGWSVAHNKPSMTLREASVISTLSPSTPLKGNTACEIFTSDDGRFLYTCTRGADEILIYKINPVTGLLTDHQRLSCGGQFPRYIVLDPSRRWLLSCNQGTPGPNPVGSVTVFAHDPTTGRLALTPKSFPADTPMFVEWM
jgi:6-phosphogluconolactonase